MSEMITADLVDLDLSADTKEAAARALAERMVTLGRVTDLEGFLADVAAREAQMPTGLDGGIGIPHCRSEHVTEPTLAFGRSAAGIDFGAADGPADLIFLIAAPAGADDAHLTILSSLARKLMNAEFTDGLRAVGDAEGAAALIRGDEQPAADGTGTATADAAGSGTSDKSDRPDRTDRPEGSESSDSSAGPTEGPTDSVVTPVAASAGAATGTTATGTTATGTTGAATTDAAT
ncbi:fructose PTS transporter subunit IIA, partial [Streptomyces hirsutus]